MGELADSSALSSLMTAASQNPDDAARQACLDAIPKCMDRLAVNNIRNYARLFTRGELHDYLMKVADDYGKAHPK